jgi:glycosyltransferase involved in cell wall biosynthesis
MRILQLTKHYPPHTGGIETVTFDLTTGLNNKGFHCDVLCCNKINKTTIEYNHGFFIERAAQKVKIFSTSISTLMIKRVKEIGNSYDIIHVHFPDPLTALALFIANPKAKIVVHWHSDIIRQKTLLILYKPLQNWVLKKASAIIATSKNYANNSAQLKPFLKKIKIVPIGISPSINLADISITNDIKIKYDKKKIIFAMGRLVYYKGFEHLIKAANLITPNAIIVIGGNGHLMPHLKKLVKELNVQHKVDIIGHIPYSSIHSYFNACDIFCLPATEKSEAFGVVLLEAMQFGKPLITTNIKESGICWVNQDNETGYNVPPKDSEKIASSINELLSNKEKYKTFSQNCINRFETYFKSEKMVDATVEIYNNILNSTKKKLD